MVKCLRFDLVLFLSHKFGTWIFCFICEKSSLEERGSTTWDAQFTDASSTSFTLFLEHYVSQMWFLHLLIKSHLHFCSTVYFRNIVFLYCGVVNCKHSSTAVSGGRKRHLKYLPAGILGGKDPLPLALDAGPGGYLKPCPQEAGAEHFHPNGRKDPFKR